jgi:hypothetical protein
MIEVKRRIRELGPAALAGALVAPLLFLVIKAWVTR